MSPEEARQAVLRRIHWIRDLGWPPGALDDYLDLPHGTTALILAEIKRGE